MAHGYLREYDEGWDRGEDRERSERREREDRDWRGRDRDWSERGPESGFMFGDEHRDRDWRDRGAWETNRDYPQRDRGMGGYGAEHGYGGFQGDYRGGREQGGFGGAGDWREARRSFSSNPDEHYRSWRDQHMQSLDRDYQEYCREREQQFHRDFNAWRSRRHGDPQPLQPGMTQSGLSGDPTGMTQAFEETAPETPQEPDPMATATLGAQGGRGRR
jgi:hypothetical protein